MTDFLCRAYPCSRPSVQFHQIATQFRCWHLATNSPFPPRPLLFQSSGSASRRCSDGCQSSTPVGKQYLLCSASAPLPPPPLVGCRFSAATAGPARWRMRSVSPSPQPPALPRSSLWPLLARLAAGHRSISCGPLPPSRPPPPLPGGGGRFVRPHSPPREGRCFRRACACSSGGSVTAGALGVWGGPHGCTIRAPQTTETIAASAAGRALLAALISLLPHKVSGSSGEARGAGRGRISRNRARRCWECHLGVALGA